ncbi:MAG: hypothetical protein ACE5D2_05900 [Fidelibacterota bacterium]
MSASKLKPGNEKDTIPMRTIALAAGAEKCLAGNNENGRDQ